MKRERMKKNKNFIKKFSPDYPECPEEKLTAEIYNDLMSVFKASISLNDGKFEDEIFFVILRDSIFGFMGKTMEFFCSSINGKEYVKEFLEQGRELYDHYAESIIKNMTNKKDK